MHCKASVWIFWFHFLKNLELKNAYWGYQTIAQPEGLLTNSWCDSRSTFFQGNGNSVWLDYFGRLYFLVMKFSDLKNLLSDLSVQLYPTHTCILNWYKVLTHFLYWSVKVLVCCFMCGLFGVIFIRRVCSPVIYDNPLFLKLATAFSIGKSTSNYNSTNELILAASKFLCQCLLLTQLITLGAHIQLIILFPFYLVSGIWTGTDRFTSSRFCLCENEILIS